MPRQSSSIGATVLEDLLKVIAPGGLANLLNPSTLILGLADILSRVFGHGTDQAQSEALKLLNEKLDAQMGRTGAKELSRAILKQVDHAIEVPLPGSSPDQRFAIGQALAQNAAAAMVLAANDLLAYPALQAAVDAAKASGDAAALTAARAARDAAVQKNHQLFIDIGRAAAGQSPHH